MRNKVKIIAPANFEYTIFQLQPGQMFSYVNRKSVEHDFAGVYMKLDGFGKGNAAIYLPTGMYYVVDENAPLHLISQIELGGNA